MGPIWGMYAKRKRDLAPGKVPGEFIRVFAASLASRARDPCHHRLHAEDTKTDDARLVPLTADLTLQLKALYKVVHLNEPHVFLVNGKSVHSIKTAFKAACRRAGIEGFRFHDFRHTAVTNMRRAGIDHLTIMRITGHKTLEVFKRYNSFLEGDLKDAGDRLNT